MSKKKLIIIITSVLVLCGVYKGIDRADVHITPENTTSESETYNYDEPENNGSDFSVYSEHYETSNYLTEELTSDTTTSKPSSTTKETTSEKPTTTTTRSTTTKKTTTTAKPTTTTKKTTTTAKPTTTTKKTTTTAKPTTTTKKTTTTAKPTTTTKKTTTKQTTTTKKTTTTTKKTTTHHNSSNSHGRVIYITPTGKRYHYDSHCNGGTYIESSLEEALARGLTPCKKCVQ